MTHDQSVSLWDKHNQTAKFLKLFRNTVHGHQLLAVSRFAVHKLFDDKGLADSDSFVRNPRATLVFSRSSDQATSLNGED